MKVFQQTTSAILIMSALIICPDYSEAIETNAYQNVFSEHLEIGPAVYLKLNVHGRSAEAIDKSLTEIRRAFRDEYLEKLKKTFMA